MKFLTIFRTLWERVPFRHVLWLTIALYYVGDQYPLSNFPMYSNLPEDVDGVFVTDQAGRILPMLHVFGVSSQTSKKMYVRELKKRLLVHGEDDVDHATPAEERDAARTVLDELVRRGRDRGFGRQKDLTAVNFNRRIYLRAGRSLSFQDRRDLATATP